MGKDGVKSAHPLSTASHNLAMVTGLDQGQVPGKPPLDTIPSINSGKLKIQDTEDLTNVESHSQGSSDNKVSAEYSNETIVVKKEANSSEKCGSARISFKTSDWSKWFTKLILVLSLASLMKPGRCQDLYVQPLYYEQKQASQYRPHNTSYCRSESSKTYLIIQAQEYEFSSRFSGKVPYTLLKKNNLSSGTLTKQEMKVKMNTVCGKQSPNHFTSEIKHLQPRTGNSLGSNKVNFPIWPLLLITPFPQYPSCARVTPPPSPSRFRGHIHPSQSAGQSIDPSRRISNLELTCTPGRPLYLPYPTQNPRVSSKSDYKNPSIRFQPSLPKVLPNWLQSSETVPDRMILLALLLVTLQGDVMNKVNSNHPQTPGRLRCGQEAAVPNKGTPTQDFQPWIFSQNHKIKRLVLSQHVYQVEPSQFIIGSDLVPHTAQPHTTNLNTLSQYPIHLTNALIIGTFLYSTPASMTPAQFLIYNIFAWSLYFLNSQVTSASKTLNNIKMYDCGSGQISQPIVQQYSLNTPDQCSNSSTVY